MITTAAQLLEPPAPSTTRTRSVPVPATFPPAVQPLRTGQGAVLAHHGEILQGMFYSPEGTPEHALVTLPCARLRTTARFRPLRSGPLTVAPKGRPRALMAARLTLDALGRTGWGGSLRIESSVPLRWGCGSSTTDVLSTIRAVADAFGETLEPAWIARISVAAETASDSLMYGPERAVLFAQRRRSLLQDLGGPLPPVRILGVNTEGCGTETLSLPAIRYSAWEIEAFGPILGLLRRAIDQQDGAMLGRVATASSLINQRHRPKRAFPDVMRVAEQTGALGVQVAHSGTVVGLLYAPGDATNDDVERACVELAALRLESWEFDTCPLQPERAS
jgi:uncharacterized protein involved in propanediol utilization